MVERDVAAVRAEEERLRRDAFAKNRILLFQRVAVEHRELVAHRRHDVVRPRGRRVLAERARRARVRARPLFVVVRRRDRLEELGHVGARVRLVEVRVERRVALVVLGLGRGAVAQEEVDLRGRRVIPRSAEVGRGGAAATRWIFRRATTV